MANQGQNPPQQEQPFVAAKQVGFNIEDIILNTNNEVALLYPEHTNKETLKCVSDFISMFYLREPFTRSPHMYKEYLAEFWYSTKALENSKVSFLIPTCGIYGEVGVNTFRNATGSHYLPYSSEYVAPPSIDIVRPRFETIGYGETVLAKWTLKKSLLPPRWSQEATKGASNIAKQNEKVEASRTIKLEDLAKLVKNVQPSFKDLDSPQDDHIIVVNDSGEDEEADKDGLHATSNIETKNTSVPKSSSPRSSQIQELTNHVLILQSQKHKLELKKSKAKAEAVLLNDQPSFPNAGQLN
ncbi:hypothetical protein Tco_0322032 [Tanacetum coccineum]